MTINITKAQEITKSIQEFIGTRYHGQDIAIAFIIETIENGEHVGALGGNLDTPKDNAQLLIKGLTETGFVAMVQPLNKRTFDA